MKSIAWWAAITFLIFESCTMKPVVLLETAGSVLMELPESMNLDDYYQVAPRIVSDGKKSDTLLFLFCRSIDSVWVYRLGVSRPIGCKRLATPHVRPESITFDDVSRRVLVYCEDSRPDEIKRYVESYTYEMDLIRTDTLTVPVDDDGFTYSVYSGPVYDSRTLTFSVSAQVYRGEEFLSKPCLAQYNLQSKSWRFVHRCPIEIQEDTNRFSNRPIIASYDRNNSWCFFRYPLSDSIYSLNVSGVVQNVLFSKSGVDYHAPVPQPVPSGWDPFTIEPFVLSYFYLNDADMHVSLLKERQPLRRPDGRLTSLKDAPCSLVFTRGPHTETIKVPAGLITFIPDPFVIGDVIAFARRSKVNEQTGRITLSLFRMRIEG